MSNEKERAYFKRYKEDVNRDGKPFFPYAMFHDTVMSLVVVCVIVALACIWYFTSGEEAGDAGLLGPRYTEEADPGTTSFVPRPDWYFYFLFYLLRIFKWPESVVLGTVGIPTVLLIIMFLLPFVDRRREQRLVRRPVAIVAALLVIASMGILTYKGATAKESLASENVELVGEWTEVQGLSEEGEAGATLFAESGCMNCHTYLGAGLVQPRRAGPVGGRAPAAGRRGVRRLHRQPVAVREQRHAVRTPRSARRTSCSSGTFLEESKGEGGGE